MKKSNFFKLLFVFAAIIIGLNSCDSEEDPVESCSQDEICTAKNVTACCDETSCTYEYDGKEYQESELDQLAEDLGCTTSGGRYAANSDLEEVKLQLLDLVARARSGLE
ncbi:hypothetical protein [Chondrinema litorale]|uniref:hypothetical protein n=1 Tax=Chondrinema litorale TaxID=2994555 RepID=UPI002543EC9C|nr:hypothetical protein [Chondrinema litorale]UZR97366.1 hypothetical protein OQ292_26040 [Chondrinema litorale]